MTTIDNQIKSAPFILYGAILLLLFGIIVYFSIHSCLDGSLHNVSSTVKEVLPNICTQ